MISFGYRPEDSVIRIPFTTHAATGAPVAPSSAFEAADIAIYKNGSATQKTTANGLTMTSPFDSVTGLHLLEIDTSVDTGDVGFWADGGDYFVVLNPDETVDGLAALKVLGTFRLGRAPADATAINSSTAAAIRLALSAGQMIPGTVDTATNTHTPTATVFQADDITEATANHYQDRAILWTSGALIGQMTGITAYSQVGGIGQFTVQAMTESPANNDTFLII